MSIITNFSAYKAIEKELRTGHELQRQTERARERQAANQAKQFNGQVANPNGMALRKLASIPAREFFQVAKKYGNEAWSDDEFLADFRKRHPHLTTNFCPQRKRPRAVTAR